MCKTLLGENNSLSGGGGRGEWILNRERIPKKEYRERYIGSQKVKAYDPAEWCQLAVDAGMGYILLTTRHDEGFSLLGSMLDDFSVVEMGPKRNLLALSVDAAHHSVS